MTIYEKRKALIESFVSIMLAYNENHNLAQLKRNKKHLWCLYSLNDWDKTRCWVYAHNHVYANLDGKEQYEVNGFIEP